MSVCPNCYCSTLKLDKGYRKCDVCKYTIKEEDLEETYYAGVVDNDRYRPGRQLLEKLRQYTKSLRKKDT